MTGSLDHSIAHNTKWGLPPSSVLHVPHPQGLFVNQVLPDQVEESSTHSAAVFHPTHAIHADALMTEQQKQQAVDFSDNPAQLQVIRHHYQSEFGHAKANAELLQDYRPDSVVYQVVNDQPTTYHGLEGARQSCQGIASLLNNGEPDLQHVSVHDNHAQVVWKAETSNHETVMGTDSFTFDQDNHIQSQTVVALTEKSGSDTRKD